MSSIRIEDLVASETIELIVHHNNPLTYTQISKDRYQWVITKAVSSFTQEDITHLTGMLVSNDVENKILNLYGGPYAAKGLSSMFVSRGVNKEAAAQVPWQYINQLWVLRRKEIDVLVKHQRLTTERIKVLV